MTCSFHTNVCTCARAYTHSTCMHTFTYHTRHTHIYTKTHTTYAIHMPHTRDTPHISHTCMTHTYTPYTHTTHTSHRYTHMHTCRDAPMLNIQKKTSDQGCVRDLDVQGSSSLLTSCSSSARVVGSELAACGCCVCCFHVRALISCSGAFWNSSLGDWHRRDEA